MRAVGAYDGELRAIIQALKYDGRRTIASRLGALMRDAGREVLDGADGVVPVPLHPRRQRQRGFNQAVLLARHLRLPVHDVLRRIVNTRPQVEVPAARRHGNVRAAFAVAPVRLRGWRSAKRGPAFPARVLVLVDDVMTTGATLGACALVLKQAGVGEVRALTAARAVSGPPRSPVR
jgi:ComF family protein